MDTRMSLSNGQERTRIGKSMVIINRPVKSFDKPV